MIIKYMLLGVFSIYSVCAHDQDAAAAAGLDEVEQRFLRIRTQAGDIEVDEAGIEALASQMINNMIAGDSDVLSVSGDVSADNKAISDGLDLSDYFENTDQFTAFANAMQEGRYQSEPIDMVLRILKAGNYLLVSQEKIKRYMESVARVNPLLLYQLSQDASLPQGLSALISYEVAQLVPFQLQQRLGAVGNVNPAAGHTAEIWVLHWLMVIRS